jgi:membrane protease YdiL (CAAX protease family)
LGDRPEAPVARESWKSAGLALGVALAIAALGTAVGFAAAGAFDVWSRIDEPRAFAAGEMQALWTARLAISLFAFQSVTVLLVFAADAHLRRAGTPYLGFAMPEGGPRTLLLSAIALVVLAGLFGSLVYASDREAFHSDMAPFVDMMRSRTWWLVLIAAGIGAPLAEECLFRGLLFGALKATPIGLVGAALVTSVLWASLHANYSTHGLVAITLIGLYLAYVRERTGTLLTPIVCHSAYNSLIVLTLALAPDGALGAG